MRFLKLLLVSLFASSSVFAQCLLREVSFSDKANNSSVIFEGKVIEKHSFWNESQDRIFTSNTIDLYKIFRGTISQSKVVVITEGGEIGAIRHIVEPALQLNIGQEGLFFANPSMIVEPGFGRSSAPSFEAYASLQGFFLYDRSTDRATTPFKVYQGIETGLYEELYAFVGSRPIIVKNPANNQKIQNQFLAPSITSISPTSISAGTNSILTITGTGFGATQGTSVVQFKSADDGGATYITPLATQYLSWSDTQIQVRVPSRTTGGSGTAGTGTVQVVNGTTATSSQTLTVTYGELNVSTGTPVTAYQTDHVNKSSGGYVWQMYTGFDANAAAKASFQRALGTWRCGTYVNWSIGTTTATNAAASDGVNVVRFDVGTELPAGVLGRCTSYWSSCATGVWYVNELDIVFDDGTNWNFTTSAPTASQYDFETVALHELGHGHQLSHVIASTDVMHYAVSNGTMRRTLNANNLAGGNDVMSRSVVANSCGPGAMTALNASNCALGSPTADFSGTPTSGCNTTLTVNFTDLSTGGPTSWAWDIDNNGSTDYTTQNPSHTYTSAGTYSVKLTVTNANGSNTITKTNYVTLGSAALPLIENFELPTFPPSGFSVTQSPTDTYTWYRNTTAAGNGASTGCASISYFDYSTSGGEKDNLIVKPVSLTSVTGATMTFKVAYAYYPNPVNYDSLKVYVSTDCGATYGSAIYLKGGVGLATAGSNANAFTPTLASHWRTETVNLNSYAGNNIVIKFEGVNRYGNNLYIDDINITGSSAPVANFTGTPVSGCSPLTVSFTDLSTGTPTSWAWDIDNNGTTDYTTQNPTHVYSTAGTYSVKLTVTNGSGSNTFTRTNYITVYPNAALSASVTNVTCNGLNNGSATVTPIGGNTPYTYAWNTAPVQTTATATNLAPGTYTVTVTTTNGCTSTTTAIITQPTALAGSTSQVNVSCNGGNNGSGTVTPSGGTSPYTYSWNTTPSQTSATATNLAAGTYSVTVTDNKGCSIVRSVIITQPALLSAGTTSAPVSCFGGTNGTASVTPAGGTTPYTYSWNTTPSQTTATATNLAAGTYSVTVTDNKGCSLTRGVVITQPTPLSYSTSSTTTSCTAATGTASVFMAGGTGAYTYSWNSIPSQTTATATSLSAGTYSVTISDANNCIVTASVTVTTASGPLASISSTTNVSCNGGTNGSATGSATGGTTPYTYAWSTAPVQTTATATGLTAGAYTFTVTDNAGCSATATATITQPPVLAGVTSQVNVSCNGGNNASGTVTASGGTAPYTYSWNTTPSQTSATASNLAAGTYSVTVTDNKGCSIVRSVIITQPALLSAGTSSAPVSCFGGTNGTASVTPAGGTTPYTYSWNTTPSQTTATATNLAAGTYSVTVTDNKSCVITRGVIVTQPTAIALSPSSTTTSCTAATGTASVSASGGTGAFTYSWNTTPSQTTATATNLSAGTYSVTVRDANNCVATSSAIVTTATGPSASIIAVTNVSCNGGTNGSATGSATGGTTPYTYAWSTTPAQTTTTATGLGAGVFTFTVTDNAGCSVTATVTITQPSVLAGVTSQVNVNCNGGNNGSGTVTASGGTAPYTYSWNTVPSQTSATATNLAAGTYSVTVTDNKGCSIVRSVAITHPAVLNAGTSSTSVSCFGGTNGTASVTPTGGTTPYTYSWNTTPSQTTATATNLSSGTYSATITDSKGCVTTKTVVVTQPAVLNANNTQVNVSCNGGSNGSSTLTVSGGISPYTYSWNTTPAQTTATANNLSAGTYSATVTDNKGCITTNSVVITQPAALSANSTQTNVSCNGGTNGTATLLVTGGTGAYTYSWNSSPAQSTVTATNLSAGTYIATITDNNGCVTTRTVVITQPAVLSATSTQVNVSCNGGNNGSSTLTVTGGTSPYTYSWNTTPAQTTPSATNLGAGTYSATVTDNKGCTTTKSVVITQPAPLSSALTQTNVLCNGASTGSATVSATGGTMPFTYSWSPVSGNTTTITNLSAGTYSVTVTDNKGCVTSNNVIITQPTAITSTMSQTNASCNGIANGSATVTVTGGTPSYLYSWNTSPSQSTPTASNLAAGTYSVTITDNNGCSKTSGVVISQPSAIVMLVNPINVTCFGSSDGSAVASVGGGTGAYTYSWSTSPVQTGTVATNLSPGTYILTVTDAAGCVGTQSTTISEPAEIEITLSVTNTSCSSCSDGAITSTVTGGNGSFSYSWSNGSTAPSINNVPDSVYTLCVTDMNGCTKCETDSVIADPVSVTESKNQSIHFYPNPAREEIYVVIPNASSDMILYITDGLGQLVSEEIRPVSGVNELKVSSLARGIYFLNIREGGKVRVEKMIRN